VSAALEGAPFSPSGCPTRASVVIHQRSDDPAFCSAVRTTLSGSIHPLLPGLRIVAERRVAEVGVFPSSTFPRNDGTFRRRHSRRFWRSGSWMARRTMLQQSARLHPASSCPGAFALTARATSAAGDKCFFHGCTVSCMALQHGLSFIHFGFGRGSKFKSPAPPPTIFGQPLLQTSLGRSLGGLSIWPRILLPAPSSRCLAFAFDHRGVVFVVVKFFFAWPGPRSDVLYLNPGLR